MRASRRYALETPLNGGAKRLLEGNRKWRSLTTCRRNYTLICIDHYSDQNRKLIGAENKPSAYKGIVNKQLKSAKN